MITTQKEVEHISLLYKKQIEEGKRIATTLLAKELGGTSDTVPECFQKIAVRRLVDYKPCHDVHLTKEGIVESEKMLRKHRLLEILFVRLLGYSPQVAFVEASRIDYFCSESLTNRICKIYRHPVECSCNKRIIKIPLCGKNNHI
jgi:DtxR family Mn-dependent transcriptional regulator